MSLKKHPKADLDKKRVLFLQIGLVASLAITLVAFEWKSYDKSDYDLGNYMVDEPEEEIIPITRAEPPPPPPPEEIPPPPPPTVFKESKEDKQVEVEFNTESDEKDRTKNYEQEEASAPAALPFIKVEQMPAFPGCENKNDDELATCNYIATTKFFNENKSYPYLERENGIEGTVYINFVIDETGKVSDIKILKSVSPGLDKEAIRLISKMPKWTAGKQRGKSVKVSQTLPMKFSLN